VNVIVQQPLASSGVVFAACVGASEEHFEQSFYSSIVLLASFVTVVKYSSSYEPTGLSFL